MMTKSGFAFHCHHDRLWEWVHDFDERVNCIKIYKPPKEVELRLRLFQLIPTDRIPEAYNKAREAYDKAKEACNKAGAARDKAREAYDKAWEARDKAREARDKAWEAYDKAWAACEDYFITLHAELCPNCPWNGETIFPDGAIASW